MRIRFFFQAEDGIRDIGVTGVQTCALPISLPSPWPQARQRVPPGALPRNRLRRRRSEERRVGKECRSRWSPYHYKKKENTKRSVHIHSGVSTPTCYTPFRNLGFN